MLNETANGTKTKIGNHQKTLRITMKETAGKTGKKNFSTKAKNKKLE